MQKTLGLLLSLSMMLGCGAALAAGQCYDPAELQAEQLLRLHSQLMVITVTCRQGSGGENLVPAYTGFTNANIGALHDAEQILAHYYSAHYGGDGVARLDTIRTRLANEFGQKIAAVSAPIYCGQYRDKVLDFYQAGAKRLQDEVRRMVVAEKSYVRSCEASETRVAKNGE